MAQKLYEERNIRAIADAIRAKNGETTTYKTSEMAAAIENIAGGGWDAETVIAVMDKSITTVVIPDGTTKIGAYAFYKCYNLVSVTLPEGIETICNHAFESCNGLTSITLPSSLNEIQIGAFNYDYYLATVTFKGTPTSIQSMIFNGCSNLATINVPWAEGEVSGAPWGAYDATINYNYNG